MKRRFWTAVHDLFHHWHIHWADSRFMQDITHICYYHAGLKAGLFTTDSYQ